MRMLLPLVVFALLSLAGVERPVVGTFGDQVARFQHQLVKSGYVSQSGEEKVVDFNKEYCRGNLYSAMWANPQALRVFAWARRVRN